MYKQFIVANRQVLYLLALLLSGCASIEKHNLQITKLHTPEELRDDVDFAYRKLQKLQPDLYWYISKDSLDKKFSLLKNNLQQPLSTKEFYQQIAPVIASIRQGHNMTYPSFLKQTRKEKKERGRREHSFKPLGIKNIGNKLFISKNYGEDSTLMVGSELLSVDSEKTEDLLASSRKLYTGDGFNKTFKAQFTSTYFFIGYLKTHRQKDSVLITLNKNDSIYSHYLYANYKNEAAVKKTSVDITAKKLSKAEKKLAKKKKKARKAWEEKHGYDKYKKESARNFEFIKSDSTPTISYIKIRTFTKGDYEDFYEESFSKIDSAKSEYLIIDLRDNLGGRLAEIDEFYSYLTDKEYVFVEKGKMTKNNNNLYLLLHSGSWVVNSIVALISPYLIIRQIIKIKKENGHPYYKFKQSKPRSSQPNNYKGKIYVLINGTSFSASCILSAHLTATKRATFVGEETGGAYNGTVAGRIASIELPNSKVNMRIGLMTLKTPYTQSPDGFGIKPDIQLTTSTLEYDEQLEWVISDIKSK